MLTRDQIIDTIDWAYATRVRGDKAALAALWAEGATYGLGGEPTLIPRFPTGPGDAEPAVRDLIDLFTFHEVERIDDIVEGDRAAILWRVTLSRGDGECVTTQVSQLWTFTDDGKVLSLREFGDTALIAKLLA